MFSTTKAAKAVSSVIPHVSRSVLGNAGKFLNQSAARSSSMLSRLRSSSSIKVLGAKRAQVFSKTCSCGVHHKLTEGDHDIVDFLDQEIDYEKEAIQDLPKLKDFKVHLDGSSVTLSRKHNGERIIVSFDVNENVNVDETMGDEEAVEDEDAAANIVSYPSFKVQIVKDSGRTLAFVCAFNTSMQEEMEEEDSMSEIFRFDSVSVWPNPEAQDEGENVYEAETENMDGHLYKLLLNALYERGINNDFARDLLDTSTVIEHKEYVNFLQDLKGFFSSKH